MSLICPSPAKLNLFLYITGQRPNGYHELQTLFQFLDYGDTLTFTPNDSGEIRLLTPIDGVDDQHNLIVKAAKMLKPYAADHCGVDISLHKILPMGGGLGGGSSNAATTLVALNTLWQCNLSQEQLAEIGLKLGADIPIFIYGHAAFAEGIGEKLIPITPTEKWYLVAHPGISIPTETIFNDPELKRDSEKRDVNELLKQPFANNCEDIARKRYPEVEQLISWLLQYAPSRLTGTGACVFAEFDTESTARAVLNKAPDWLQGFVAKGVNVSPLSRTMSALR